MRDFRIAWYAIVEDDSLLEGRSLIKAGDEKEAVGKLVAEKSVEYRLKPQMIMINSITELLGKEAKEKGDS